MQNKLWYNISVAGKFEKKDQPLALRVPSSLLKTLEQISKDDDRPLGYVARELMVRGLALYKVDGRLRDEPQPVKAAAPVVANISPSVETLSKREIAKTINPDQVAEIERRIGKTKAVPIMKKKAT